MIINSRHAFYKSTKWKECKQRVLLERVREDGGIYCEYCGKLINTSKQFDPQSNDNRSVMIFHHKIELTESNYMDYEISLNPKNIQIVHFACHNRIHERFGGGTPQKKVYLVAGSVCSGKSTFVQENMSIGDLVLDLDLIWQSISMQPIHNKPNSLKPIVFAIRDTVIDQIKMRSGSWQNAWVITTQSRPMEVERMANSLNAEIITMDIDRETCLQRLYDNPQGRDIELYTRLINEYFDNSINT